MNTNIKSISKLPSPFQIKNNLKTDKNIDDLVLKTKINIQNILDRKDNRLLVIVGPCSIHNYESALEYAKFLKFQRDRYRDYLEIVMRTYFSKPRTNIGWKGYIYDPDLDGSCDINKGLYKARELLININEMGVPCSMEHVDTIIPQYFDDLVSWSAIGARTSESQIHRELSSGISCPVGFKNGTKGDINVAINGIKCANNPQIFLGCDMIGNISRVETNGNKYCHIILRGGIRPNYYSDDVNFASKKMEELGLNPNIVIDFSHGNSLKEHKRQLLVCEDVCKQIKGYQNNIRGVMIESNLEEGKQNIKETPLKYGKSITDACINLLDTEIVLNQLYLAISH